MPIYLNQLVMKNILPAFFALLLSFTGGSLLAQTPTVAEIIADVDSLSTLNTLLEAADLTDTLGMEGTEFTVFAPTNAAFELLSEDDLAYFSDEDNADSLMTVLLYHVVSDSLPADSLFNGMVASLSGDSLMIDTVGMVTVNGVMVTMADIMASNGVVHTINAVLMPSMVDTTSTSVRQEPAFAREVSIAPNPATSQMTINLPYSILSNATLTLRDLSGRTVLTRRATSDRERIEVGNLPAGPYLLEVRADAGAIQRKVMVQR